MASDAAIDVRYNVPDELVKHLLEVICPHIENAILKGSLKGMLSSAIPAEVKLQIWRTTVQNVIEGPVVDESWSLLARMAGMIAENGFKSGMKAYFALIECRCDGPNTDREKFANALKSVVDWIFEDEIRAEQAAKEAKEEMWKIPFDIPEREDRLFAAAKRVAKKRWIVTVPQLGLRHDNSDSKDVAVAVATEMVLGLAGDSTLHLVTEWDEAFADGIWFGFWLIPKEDQQQTIKKLRMMASPLFILKKNIDAVWAKGQQDATIKKEEVNDQKQAPRF
jgi:hypothetical protein